MGLLLVLCDQTLGSPVSVEYCKTNLEYPRMLLWAFLVGAQVDGADELPTCLLAGVGHVV